MGVLSIFEQNLLAAWARQTRLNRKLWHMPDAIQAIREAERRILASYSHGEIVVLQRPDDQWHCMVHPSTKYPDLYQVTFCNHTGFLCDSTFGSIQEAVKECLLHGYCVRLEQAAAEALMHKTVEAEATYQKTMRVVTS